MIDRKLLNMIEMSREIVQEIAREEGMLLLDGFFDEAIIGLASRSGDNTVVAYSIDVIIKILMEKYGKSYPEALEHYSFHIEGRTMGDMTPMFIRLISET